MIIRPDRPISIAMPIYLFILFISSAFHQSSCLNLYSFVTTLTRSIKTKSHSVYSEWLLIPTHCCYTFFTGQLFKPTMAYRGQKLTKLVSKNTPPNPNSTQPSVPVTVPVKYSVANTAANKMRMVLSVPPMFFFIKLFFIRFNKSLPTIWVDASNV